MAEPLRRVQRSVGGMNALGNKWLRMTLTAVALSMLPGLGDRTVAAHSVVTSSNPAANARIATRDIEIEVRFNGRIDAARSKLTLMLPDRTRRTQTIKEGTQPNLLAASVAGCFRRLHLAMAGAVGRWAHCPRRHPVQGRRSLVRRRTMPRQRNPGIELGKNTT